jgi:hypothetical protein
MTLALLRIKDDLAIAILELEDSIVNGSCKFDLDDDRKRQKSGDSNR